MSSHSCSNSDHLSNDVALVERIVGAVAILVTSLVGFLLAYWTRGRWKPMIFLFRAFSSGVVLATSFMHVLADATTAMSNPCLEMPRTFPWTFLVSLYATLITFIGEYILEEFMVEAYEKRKAEKKATLAETPMEENDIDLQKIEEEEKKNLELTHLRVVAYTLEAGIVFHSIFIGIGMGSSHNVNYVKTLTIAIVFHQAFEGISLGTALCRAKLNFRTMMVLGTIFSFVTPVGIAVGILLGNSYNANSKASLGMEAFFNAISSGILIYNGIVDLIIPTFDKNAEDGPKSKKLTYLGFVFMLVGSGLMSLIAKWA